MMPPKREFEKVKVDEWLPGEIAEITYDKKHAFKNGEGPAVRIKIALDGYKFPKSTPWMIFSYSKKSNVYSWFVEPLVEGATEYMAFDLDQIKNMKVRVMFEQKGDYQNILRVRPMDSKILPDATYMDQTKEVDAQEEVPF